MNEAQQYPQRKDYMDDKVIFAEFYGSVAKAAGITFDSIVFLDKVKAALVAGDEHLNTIPLAQWDAMAIRNEAALRRALKLHGDFYSLGSGVCAFKQAARDAVMAEATALGLDRAW